MSVNQPEWIQTNSAWGTGAAEHMADRVGVPAGWSSGDVVAEAHLPFLQLPPREEPARSPIRPHEMASERSSSESHAMAPGTPIIAPDDGRRRGVEYGFGRRSSRGGIHR